MDGGKLNVVVRKVELYLFCFSFAEAHTDGGIIKAVSLRVSHKTASSGFSAMRMLYNMYFGYIRLESDDQVQMFHFVRAVTVQNHSRILAHVILVFEFISITAAGLQSPSKS
jgi:hypothetical protein